MMLLERGVDGDFGMNMTENLAYLFKGISRGITLLEEETYIFQALSTQGIRPSYNQAAEDMEDAAFVTRWPENKFPLKVYVGPDYGYLFTPIELKQLSQIIQSALLRFQEIDPETFRFTLVPDRQHADITIKYRRIESSMLSHCTPEIGREKQIKRADITLNIPSNKSHSKVLVDVVHNMLHALGIHGHSAFQTDSGAKDWNPNQQILTLRDIKTLQLLYRCPLALTKKDLKLLWQEYQDKYLSLPMNSNLEALINELGTSDGALAGGASLMDRSVEISRRELALQASFNKCIRDFKTA